MLKKFVRDELGASLLEYAMVISLLVAIVIIIATPGGRAYIGMGKSAGKAKCQAAAGLLMGQQEYIFITDVSKVDLDIERNCCTYPVKIGKKFMPECFSNSD